MLNSSGKAPYFIAPDPRVLPSIPENVSICDLTWRLKFYLLRTPLCLHLCVFVSVHQRNLTELVVAVDVTNLLQLYASMLFERRILIFARKLNTVCISFIVLHSILNTLDTHSQISCATVPFVADILCTRTRGSVIPNALATHLHPSSATSPS